MHFEFTSFLCGALFWIRQAIKGHEKEGLRYFPIDHKLNTLIKPQFTKSQALVESMLQTVRPARVHLSLPCGTCSRARDKPLPKHLQCQFHAPPPLRDAHNLLGFPYLTGTQALKVQAANDLYKWGVKILFICYSLELNVSIENPERSGYGEF